MSFFVRSYFSGWFFRSLGIVWISSYLITSCLDQIDIEVPKGGAEQLVIQGKMVIGEPTRVHVNLSKLFDFTANSRSQITARWVRLYDEDGNYLDLESGGRGDYFLTLPADDPDFPVRFGRGYYLELATFDDRVYRSDLEVGVQVPRADQLTYELVDLPALDPLGRVVPTEHVQYRVNTPLTTGEGNPRVFLNWLTEWTFKVNDTPYQPNIEQKVCYITQKLGVTAFNSLDPNALADDYLEDEVVYEGFVLRNYGEGLYFTLIQESLSETAYEFYRQVRQNTERKGNVFDAPPGAVISNIRNVEDETDTVHGFFYVTQQDTIRTYVNPESVGSPPFYCPPPKGILTQSGNCADLICCDCLSVENSTAIPPDFWEE